jgi:rubrerythrin
MRVRLNPSTKPTLRSDRRRRHAAAAPAAVPAPAAAPEVREPAVPRRTPESRYREAGGPEDRSTYACRCGYVFEAPVSTSVSCPHCGAGQAW